MVRAVLPEWPPLVVSLGQRVANKVQLFVCLQKKKKATMHICKLGDRALVIQKGKHADMYKIQSFRHVGFDWPQFCFPAGVCRTLPALL